MKWFKHDTDTDSSEGMDALFEHDGWAAQGRWFRLLEIVAKKMDYTDRCHVEYSIKKWCSLLGLKQKKLTSFLEVTEKQLRTKVVTSEKKIRIEIPNLLKKKDNHSKNLQATGNKNASKEVEVEVDKDLKAFNTSGSERPGNDKPEVIIPLVKGTFEVSQADVSTWKDTFPYIDVLAVLKVIRLWNFDHPKKRKTPAGIKRHISGWLNKENIKAKPFKKTVKPDNFMNKPPRKAY